MGELCTSCGWPCSHPSLPMDGCGPPEPSAWRPPLSATLATVRSLLATRPLLLWEPPLGTSSCVLNDDLQRHEKSIALLWLKIENQDKQNEKRNKNYIRLYFLGRTFWKVKTRYMNDWKGKSFKKNYEAFWKYPENEIVSYNFSRKTLKIQLNVTSLRFTGSFRWTLACI